MITKKELFSFITTYQSFEKAIERMEEAISGSKYGCNLFESDWYNSVGKMFDVFLESHFTEVGRDLIYYYLFENCEHIIYEKNDNNLFDKEKEKIYKLNSIDDLWNYMTNSKRIKDYVKEINN